MSGSLHTPTSSVVSSTAAERLYKRRRVISSSSESSDTSISSDLRRETYTRYRYRVGSPALRQLPLMTVDETIEEVVRFDQAEPAVRQALEVAGVRYSSIELVRRVIPQDTYISEGDRTILILANWTDDSCFRSWVHAVDRIRRLLRNQPSTRNTRVEIIAHQLTLPRGMKVVECGHRIVAAWPRLLPLIRYILLTNAALASYWLTIDLIRLGPISEHSPSLPIVVSILVDWACDPNDWDRARTDIDELLASEGFPGAHSEFEHGDIYAAVSSPPSKSLDYDKEDVIHTSYHQQVRMSDDVGAAQDFEMMPDRTKMRGGYGTFGGYLKIQKDGKQPIKVGLTNYHVVRSTIPGFAFEKDPESGEAMERTPKVSELLSKIDKNGFGPNHEMRRHTTLESPSRRKHTATMQNYHDALLRLQSRLEHRDILDPDTDQATKLRLESQKRTLEHFVANGHHILGSVLMASGFGRRTTNNHRLDWALIDMNKDRVGRNTIPEAVKWPGSESVLSHEDFPDRSVCGGPLRGKASLKDMVTMAEQGLLIGKTESRRLYKIGARTKLSHGEFSHVKHSSRLSLHDRRLGMQHSEEYCFMQKIEAKWPGAGTTEGSFSLQGDSGAFCINRVGKWMGQIWGGSARQGVADRVLTYVTPQEDILKSIEELLNKSETGWTVDLATD